MRRSASLLAAALAGGLLLTACDDGDDGSAPGGSDAAAVAGDAVAVVDNAFEPEHLEVAAGDTVTWRWEGDAPHDVVGDGFDSGVQREGTFAHTFEEAGTYEYDCTVHPGMDGRVTVVEG